MTAHTGWREHAAAVLERSGYRTGAGRDAVVSLLGDQRCCATAHEIFHALRRRRSSIGLATVYRVLEQLAQLGLVQRLEFADAARYEPILPSGEHHHHLVCDACGKVEPFSDAPLERALDRLGGIRGYELGAHDVVLRGACGDCQTAA